MSYSAFHRYFPHIIYNIRQITYNYIRNFFKIITIRVFQVGEKFRSRALKFPSLISGCTINWFTPWPKDALIAVAEHFVLEYPMECTPETKKNIIYVLGSVQDSVAGICDEYFQR
jgi:hypothetical protein